MKKKEYIIAGSLLSLAIVGMVFAYNTESGDKKSQEKRGAAGCFSGGRKKTKETAKDEVEDVSSILKAKRKKKEEQKQEQKQKAETQKEEVNVAKGRTEGAGDSK